MRLFIIFPFLVIFTFLRAQDPYVSEVWVADNGDGTYKNPILYADYSDPDMCRVGKDYYMVSSSFNCIPGLQIVHSNDLVNWKLIGYAVDELIPKNVFSTVQHGNGVWAPSIRYHKGEFYIYYGDPDFGIYMTKAKRAEGPWEPLTLVKEGQGLIDACPLWDDDGKVYLVHAYAGSRAGIKSVLAVTRLSDDGKKALGKSHIIYDGHKLDETIEGPKFYKRNGYYYVLAPAGGVATGWQAALRSKNIFGPYERKTVMSQGETSVNGPHQGAWIDTEQGENWFVHFQDLGVYGRVVHLQPVEWKNDWPVIGIDKDGDGCGEPVMAYKKPNVGMNYPIETPAESDEFTTFDLGLQWQWHANSTDWWSFCDVQNGQLNLYSVPVPENYKNLYDIPNLLLQKWPAPEFTATCKLRMNPNKRSTGERVGLIIMGLDYAHIAIEYTKKGFILSQSQCIAADRGTPEEMNESVELGDMNEVYLNVKITEGGVCTFSYSLDNVNFLETGKPFKAKEGKWIGAKTGLFITRPVANNDGGYASVDWFRIISNP
jgi:beta-xylosidase